MLLDDYPQPGTSHPITYDDLINEQDEPRFYEIAAGIRTYTLGKSYMHNKVKTNIANALHEYCGAGSNDQWIMAPHDIVINRDPLCVRQPDCGLVSSLRWGDTTQDQAPPFDFSPELIVEVADPTDVDMLVPIKLPEYASIAVLEAWIVYPERCKIEQWGLSIAGPPHLERTASAGEILRSLCFPSFVVDVSSMIDYHV